MFNQATKNEILEVFETASRDMVAENCSDVDIARYMEEGNVDLLKRGIFKVQNNIIASVPEGIPDPKMSLYITPVGKNSIDVVTISASNRYDSNKKFKFKHMITKKNATADGVADIFKDIYRNLIMEYMINENLELFNDVLKGIVADAGVGYSVKVVSPLGNEGKKVASLSDEEVTFVVDAHRIFEIDDFVLLAEPSEDIPEEQIASVRHAEAEAIAACQTTEQLVEKHGGITISYLADINKQVKTMTLIRKVCTRGITKVKGNKEVTGYWEEGDTYALVVKREDGHYDIVLSPFDTKTLRKVDVDVISKLA